MYSATPSPGELARRRINFAKSTVKNNMKGLTNGVALFTFVSLAQVLFSLFSPTWLSLRTDAGRDQCWRNDGILRNAVHTGTGSHCPDPKDMKSSSFCNDDPQSGLCQATQTAAMFSLCNIVTLSSLLFLHVLSRRRHLKDLIALFLFLSLLSASLGVATLYVMFSSPLYSDEYFEQLHVGDDGNNHFGIPFTGYASCSFDTPFARLTTLWKSSIFRCVFPGSAALVAVLQVISSLVLFVFACIMLYYVKTYQDVIRMPIGSLTTSVASNSIDSGSTAIGERGMGEDPSPALRRHLMSSATKKTETNHNGHLDHLERFSIFGEFERRFKHRSRVHRFFVISFVPLALVILQGCTLMAYLLNGISIVSEVTVSIKLKAEHQPQEIYRDELNVFNFSPLTATSFFWEARARVIAIASFAAIAVLPLFKLVIWTYFVFVPSQPVIRSRALFVADMSGKFQLMNLFILTISSVSTTYARTVTFPMNKSPLFLNELQSLESMFPPDDDMVQHFFVPRIIIDSKTSLNPGVGSWMFEVTFVTSLLIGQLLITANTSAGEWHERAKRESIGLTTQLEQIDEEVGGEEALYQAERNITPYQWTETENHDDMLFVISPSVAIASSAATNAAREAAAAITISGPSRRFSSSTNSLLFTSPRRSNLSRRSSITSLHPHVLALCDRTMYPHKGVRLKFTTRGKAMMMMLLLATGILLVVCQVVVVFHVHVSRLFGVLKGGDDSDFSLMTMFSILSGAQGQTSLFDVATLFFVTTCMAPTLRLFGMVFLWMLPLTLVGKRQLLHALEILSAWSSLDVFLLSLIIMFFELERSTSTLVNQAMPGMVQLLHWLLPPVWGNITASIHPSTFGFTLLVSTVVLDKVVAHIVFEQAVASIAERIADETLNEAVIAVAVNGAIRESPFELDQPQLHQHRTGASASIDDEISELGATRTIRLPTEEAIVDAAEGILETSAVTYFGPAERYFSALMPNKMYAGFPRVMWSKMFKSLGIVDDAEAVTAFYNEGDASGLEFFRSPAINT